MIVDVSGSQEKFIKVHERDIETFLKAALEPKDEAFAVCFGNHLRLVSDFSESSDKVIAGIHAFDKGERGTPELGPLQERELGTAFFDAVYFSTLEKIATKTQRRKVLVVFSDGEENSSEHDLLDTISAAQAANVLIYAIRYTDAKHGVLSARDRYGVRVLDHLTSETGGKAYDVATTKLPEAFAAIAGEIRSLYDVGYQTTNTAHNGEVRKVVIESGRPGVTILSRARYYAR